MARKWLAKKNGERLAFTAIFERFGTKTGWHAPLRTVLLKNIQAANGEAVCDHIWFNLTVGFNKLSLAPGDRVGFEARVQRYLKGYQGRRAGVYYPIEVDFKLSRPTRVTKVAGTAEQGCTNQEGQDETNNATSS